MLINTTWSLTQTYLIFILPSQISIYIAKLLQDNTSTPLLPVIHLDVIIHMGHFYINTTNIAVMYECSLSRPRLGTRYFRRSLPHTWFLIRRRLLVVLWLYISRHSSSAASRFFGSSCCYCSALTRSFGRMRYLRERIDIPLMVGFVGGYWCWC
jgi:hypothetical protein